MINQLTNMAAGSLASELSSSKYKEGDKIKSYNNVIYN